MQYDFRGGGRGNGNHEDPHVAFPVTWRAGVIIRPVPVVRPSLWYVEYNLRNDRYNT